METVTQEALLKSAMKYQHVLIAYAYAMLRDWASAQDAIQWLTRVSNAARTLNYTGTIVNQYGGRIETSRIVHLNDNGQEWEKLTSLDGPAREAATMRAAEARPGSEVPADYLLAHQEYAPGMAFQGLGPALRTVSATTGVEAPK